MSHFSVWKIPAQILHITREPVPTSLPFAVHEQLVPPETLVGGGGGAP